MKFIIILSILFFSLLSSLEVSALTDSIGVKVKNGQRYILHRVEQGEGFYAISRKYGIPVDMIMDANPQTDDGLVLGEIILIPVDAVIEDETHTYHIVKSGETLYSIARENEVSVAEIKEWNRLMNNEISIGQKLIVSQKAATVENFNSIQPAKDDAMSTKNEDRNTMAPALTAKDGSAEVEASDAIKPLTAEEIEAKEYEEKYETKISSSGEFEEISEQGKATWINDAYMSTRKSLALHKSAPPGTVVKVKNLMNGKEVYVKVVGYLDKDEDDKILITISKTAADKLEVKDDFFRAQLNYSLPLSQK